jgi:hypothetical protein
VATSIPLPAGLARDAASGGWTPLVVRPWVVHRLAVIPHQAVRIAALDPRMPQCSRHADRPPSADPPDEQPTARFGGQGTRGIAPHRCRPRRSSTPSPTPAPVDRSNVPTHVPFYPHGMKFSSHTLPYPCVACRSAGSGRRKQAWASVSGRRVRQIAIPVTAGRARHKSPSLSRGKRRSTHFMPFGQEPEFIGTRSTARRRPCLMRAPHRSGTRGGAASPGRAPAQPSTHDPFTRGGRCPRKGARRHALQDRRHPRAARTPRGRAY